MRMSVLVALMLLTTAAMAPRPAAAHNYPWCATYYDSSRGMKQCAFATYEQCLVTVSGIGGHCSTNPFYSPSPYAEHHRAKSRVVGGDR
jgi:Protein of unknown function (DUF3551)